MCHYIWLNTILSSDSQGEGTYCGNASRQTKDYYPDLSWALAIYVLANNLLPSHTDLAETREV
jgi:hypothetical protein